MILSARDPVYRHDQASRLWLVTFDSTCPSRRKAKSFDPCGRPDFCLLVCKLFVFSTTFVPIFTNETKRAVGSAALSPDRHG